MVKCGTCGGKIELGSSITKGCKECYDTYLSLRADAERRGIKLPPLAEWVIKLESKLSRLEGREL